MRLRLRNIHFLLLVALGLCLPSQGRTSDQCRGELRDNEVRLFREQKYTGECRRYFLDPENRHKSVHDVNLKSKGGQSIMVGSKVKAALFNEDNFLSKKQDTLWIVDRNKTWSTTKNSEVWNVKSLIVFPRGQDAPHGILIARERYKAAHHKRRKAIYFVALPDDRKYNSAGKPFLNRHVRNHARRVWIYGPNTECQLWRRKEFKGGSVTLPGAAGRQSSYSLKSFRSVYKDVDSLKVWEKR